MNVAENVAEVNGNLLGALKFGVYDGHFTGMDTTCLYNQLLAGYL